MLEGAIVESARSIPYGGIKLLEIMYSLPTVLPPYGILLADSTIGGVKFTKKP
jgi:hypothetical protein